MKVTSLDGTNELLNISSNKPKEKVVIEEVEEHSVEETLVMRDFTGRLSGKVDLDEVPSGIVNASESTKHYKQKGELFIGN